MKSSQKERITKLCENLGHLSNSQLDWIEIVVSQFQQSADFWRDNSSDLINECVLKDFGDALRIHHCFSRESFTKDKFEYTLERVLNLCGINAELAPRGNPGHDINIKGQRVSLKTQADKSIREDYLHISKFMELGKGQWGDDVSDLVGLRDQFFSHMDNYDRIFSLRGLKAIGPNAWYYELVEIPKSLLLQAKDGRLEMAVKSKQSPKPGYCHVENKASELLFQLYFDGGTERKLQIKRLSKENCIVHAKWKFETESS